MKNTFSFLIIITFLVSACSPTENNQAKRVDTETSEFSAKAPKEQTEALNERQTEWSQSTYAEKPAPDSLVKTIKNTMQ